MKYISYLVVIGILAGAGFFIYNKYWKKPASTAGPSVRIPVEKTKIRADKNTLIIPAKAAKKKQAALTPEQTLYKQAEDAKTDNEALAAYRKLVSDYPDTREAISAAITLGDYLNAEEKYESARGYYTFAHDRLQLNERAGVYAKITAINDHLVWSHRVYPGVKDTTLYLIQPGDSLNKIAARFNCPVRFIKKINRMKGNRITFGQRIKVIKGTDSNNMYMRIRVVKSEYRLYVYLNGYLLKKYPIGIGRDDLTPSATFKLIDRIENPDWHKPGEIIRHGDPRNILGDYYLKFGHDRYSGFGIHGTTDKTVDPKNPTSIQKAASAGCIRMFDKDIEELFSIIPRGTLITIKK